MAPPLMEELVEEILLRLPPTEPASLLRAALVCKRWCRMVCGRGFRRRFGERHRTPPMLGFLLRYTDTRFVSTSSFRPRPPISPDFAGTWYAVDARHGRVLFENKYSSDLLVWNPVTGERWRDLYRSDYINWATTLLCATPGCDHLDCADGPFLVVCVVTDEEFAYACVYSSEVRAWGETTSLKNPSGCDVDGSNALVGNSLYFTCYKAAQILEYNVSTRKLSEISLPPGCNFRCKVPMVAEDGGLGFAAVKESKLCLWSRGHDGMGGHAGWGQRRVIELHKLLPAGGLSDRTVVVAVADGVGVVFVRTDVVYFAINLKSGQARQVYKGRLSTDIIPYMSFYTPALG